MSALPRMYPRMGCVMPAGSEATSPVIVPITCLGNLTLVSDVAREDMSGLNALLKYLQQVGFSLATNRN